MGFGFDPTTHEGMGDEGEFLNVEGGFHVLIQDMENADDDEAATDVHYEVLAGTVPGMEGKTFKDKFFKTGGSWKRLKQFAIASGLTTIAELKAAADAGKKLVPAWNSAVGRQMCIRTHFEKDEKSGKSYLKTGFDLYTIERGRALGIPINEGALSQMGSAPSAAITDAGGNGGGPAKTVGQQLNEAF